MESQALQRTNVRPGALIWPGTGSGSSWSSGGSIGASQTARQPEKQAADGQVGRAARCAVPAGPIEAKPVSTASQGSAHHNRFHESLRAAATDGSKSPARRLSRLPNQNKDLEANNQWLTLTTRESSLSPRPATSGSWLISTRARRPRPSASCTTPASTTRWARSTRAAPRWTGCPKSKSGASPSLRPPPRVCGTTTASTSSTRPATSTSPSRSRGRFASSTGPSPFSTPWRASSLKPRRYGDRPTSTACPASVLSTRWTVSGPTSTGAST